VLFIPHSQGAILLADKQDTYSDGSKGEILKLFLRGENGPAIGCSGPSVIIRKFYSDLAEARLNPALSTCEQATEVLEKIFAEMERTARYMQEGLRQGDLTIDALIVESKDGTLVLSKLEGLMHYRLDIRKMAVIPRIAEVEGYLDIDTSSFSETKAMHLGEEILRQMSFSHHTIGAPEYHGYDMIKIANNAAFLVESRNRTLEKRDASRLLDYINQMDDEG
jgi:hypothetical protein